MIGMLFQLVGDFVKSNPHIVTHTAIEVNKTLEAKKRRKEEEKRLAVEQERKKREKEEERKRMAAERSRKKREMEEKRDEELYNLAIDLEKKRLIEENEKAKDFDEDVLWEFSAKRLAENLSVRIDEYVRQKEMLDSEIVEISQLLAKMNQKMEDVEAEVRARKQAQKKFNKELQAVQRLNSMYETYVSVCNQDGAIDDIGMLTIMTACKKLKITDAEMQDIKEFTSKQGFSSSVQYLKEPKPPIFKEKSESVLSKTNKAIQNLEKEKESKLVQCGFLGELITTLKKRMPKSDVCPESPRRSDNNEIKPLQEDTENNVQSDEGNKIDEVESREKKGSVSAVDIILEAFEYGRGVEGLYIGQDIPVEKLRNAAGSMNLKEKQVVVLWDTTVFGSAKDGMLVTEEAVYFKNIWGEPRRFVWKQILLRSKNNEDGSFTVGHYMFQSCKTNYDSETSTNLANAVYDALITSARMICANDSL